ncbi:MAG: PilZ domain-containing protein [Pseudomonadales bacterium]|nr:PilZ domain-containing protein [Pseudomonadales bacterium]
MTTAGSDTSGIEKRQFTRISFDSPIQIEQGGKLFESEVVDISLKGILIKDAFDTLQHDKSTQLSIHLANETDINMLAQWDHSNNGCSGFHWTKLDIESMMHLRRLLELNNGDTELMERELNQLSHH